MKKILVTICCFAISYAYSQNPTVEQKKQAIKVVDELIYNYMQYSKSFKYLPQLKTLFDAKATVPNELIPSYFYGDKTNPEKILNVTIDDYVKKQNEIYPEGYTKVSFLNSAIDYSGLNNNLVKVIFQKSYNGTTNLGLNLESIDTILLNIKLGADFNSAIIAKVELIGHSLNHLNDDDMDFVSNDKDKCKDEKGFNTPDGCFTEEERVVVEAHLVKLIQNHKDSLKYIADIPNYTSKINTLETLAKQPPHYWLNGSVSSGILSATLTDATYGYSNHGNIQGLYINPNTTFSSGNYFQGNLGVNYFFGEKANFGVGLGFGYNMISGTATKSAFHTEYQATDKWSGIYRQIISSNGSIKEKQAYSNLIIPITLIYKGNINDKFGYNIEAGLLYNGSYSSSMNSTTASFNYEAIYQFSNITNSPTTNFDNGTSAAPNDWLITLNQGASHDPSKNGATYLNNMRTEGFNVGTNLTPVTTNKTAKFATGSIGFVFKPSVSYKLNETTSINAGLYISASSFKPSTINEYELVDNNVNYNTLMNGVSKMSNTMYGINISFVKAIFFNPKKWKDNIDATRSLLSDEKEKLSKLQNH